ncbi:MAG: hypothetical protein K9M36_02595 [Candidatus Pacebacteria bacterium]|nr:hypothetical protein [Candidatus Paceibacterota bacterium]
MNKKYLIGTVILLLLLLVAIFVSLKPTSQKDDSQGNQEVAEGHKNTSYTIEGQSIVLTDGLSEMESAPGSATKIATRYFGNEFKHDLNNDGRDDVVFLVTQERGGSGKFFYVVAALNTPTGYTGSHAFLLGDRIAPQSVNVDEGITTQGTMRDNVIVVNYTDRKPNEPMTTSPSVGKSTWIKLDPITLQFAVVAQNFEGESL